MFDTDLGMDGFDDLNGLVDFDGDTTMVDTDGDGYVDTMVEMMDTDGDGYVDRVVTTMDTDGDGLYDSAVTMDYTDMSIDAEYLTVEDMAIPDMDEFIDSVDGDIEDNPYIVPTEKEADAVVNDGVENSLHNMPPIYDEITAMQNDFEDTPHEHLFDETGQPIAENYNPEAYNPETIVGDPGAAMESFHVQDGSSSCAVVAQEFVLEQLIPGTDFDEGELCDLAEARGWLDPSPDAGTAPEDVGNVLREYGLDVSEPMTGGTLDDIERCLSDGGQVIIGVDSSELYDANDDFGPGMQADHAIQVIGIDKTDPANPMVIVNDSGIEDGAGAMIPYDHFMDAWEDSGYFMVEAYA